MKNILRTIYLILPLFIITVACNKEEIITINVEDLTVTIPENPTVGQSLGTVQTSGNGTPIFSLSNQSPSGALDIDENSGVVTVSDVSLFDFEINPVITATVSVGNGTNTATITINLSNSQELFVQDFTGSIDENPTQGQVVGTIQANSTSTLSFSITSQTPNGALNIDAGSGELSVADPNIFDYETNPVITANISVVDGVESSTVLATINLNDVDEVSAIETNITINENLSNGDVVGSLQASGSNLAYTITFQNPVGAFNINASTGELSVADETLFDYETNPNMLATISVSNGAQSVSANALVALNDLNEVGEFKYGGVIFYVNAADNDSGLVCAKLDGGINVAWGCQGTSIPGTSDSFGAGQANTDAITSNCSSVVIAAHIASNITIEGYSDWFLPSRAELNEMYNHRASINATAIANGGFEFAADGTTRYWSSSQSNGNTSWCKIFSNGLEQGLNKDATAFFRVRTVRAF